MPCMRRAKVVRGARIVQPLLYHCTFGEATARWQLTRGKLT
jgi:hypothetical protein